jgi:hypothetical protein
MTIEVINLVKTTREQYKELKLLSITLYQNVNYQRITHNDL